MDGIVIVNGDGVDDGMNKKNRVTMMTMILNRWHVWWLNGGGMRQIGENTEDCK